MENKKRFAYRTNLNKNPSDKDCNIGVSTSGGYFGWVQNKP